MKDEVYYKVTYVDSDSPDEERTTLISAPHSIDRIREILAEIHPNWVINSIILKN